jgi:sulfate/thiosulfate transport system permease protein
MKTPIYYSKKVKFFISAYTILYLFLIVLIPLSSIFFKASELTWGKFIEVAFNARSLSAYRLTFSTAFIAALINSFFGLIVAWTLVRYNFYGKKFIDALIDFPFALPTAVAGLAYIDLYSKKGWIGKFLAMLDIQVAYTPVAIVLVLTFVSIPFVIRSVQPVLEEMDIEVEKAAECLGANKWQTFRYVIMPYLLPSWLTGFTLAFARSIGEYGSVVFVAGNLPNKTEISPLLIVIRLEQFNYAAASAIAIVLLFFSFSLLLVLNFIEKWSRKYEET